MRASGHEIAVDHDSGARRSETLALKSLVECWFCSPDERGIVGGGDYDLGDKLVGKAQRFFNNPDPWTIFVPRLILPVTAPRRFSGWSEAGPAILRLRVHRGPRQQSPACKKQNTEYNKQAENRREIRPATPSRRWPPFVPLARWRRPWARALRVSSHLIVHLSHYL